MKINLLHLQHKLVKYFMLMTTRMVVQKVNHRHQWDIQEKDTRENEVDVEDDFIDQETKSSHIHCHYE